MKKVPVLILLFLLAGFTAQAQKQKVTIDDDTIKVDGHPYGIIERKGIVFDFTIKSLDGKEQIYLKYMEFYDPHEVSSANPKGTVNYFEVTFLNSGGKCEVMTAANKKGVAKIIVENNLLKDNAVDPDAEKKFIMINGTKYTEQKKSLEGPKVIIIQN
jgi:hypothetical protein